MEHYRQPQPHWLLNRSLHRRQDLSGMAVEGSIGGKVNRLSAPLRGTLKPHLPNRLGPPADDCKTTRQRLDLTCVEAIIWRHEHLRVNLVPRKLSDRVVEQRLGLGDAETAQLGVPARRGEASAVIASVQAEGHPLARQATQHRHLDLLQWTKLGHRRR